MPPAPDQAAMTSTLRSIVARPTEVWPVLVALVGPAILLAADPWRRPREIPSLVIGTVMGLAGAALVVRASLDRRSQPSTSASSPSRLRRPSAHGLYAHCRNPRYLGVVAVLAGLAMASRSPLLGLYLLASTAVLHLLIVGREEPRLARAFPDHWPAYRDNVPRWFPRPGRPRVG